MFKIEVDTKQTPAVIRVSGDTRISQAQSIHAKFKLLEPKMAYQLDCSQITETDITFMQILASFQKSAVELNLLPGSSEAFQSTLKILGMESQFHR